MNGSNKDNVNLDKVANKFYRNYKKIHMYFVDMIFGIEDDRYKDIFSSLMMTRLMILYFVQKKNLLNKNRSYLKDKLKDHRKKENNNGSFYKNFLSILFFEGFNTKPQERKEEVNKLIGNIPYLNGGVFDLQFIERDYPDIDIKDEVYDEIISFFEGFEWKLDKSSITKENQITPKVIGYIFEKYINQKEKGAYYTKRDVTDYITKYTIIPSILYKIKESKDKFFRKDGLIWELLRENPNRYIYSSIRKGLQEETLPADLLDSLHKPKWASYAKENVALTNIETWNEVGLRIKNYKEVLDKIENEGNMWCIKDLVLNNIDIKRLVEDAISYGDGEFAKEVFCIISGQDKDSGIRVLDPTCGSGAFLFSALDILESIYGNCIKKIKEVNKKKTGSNWHKRICKEVDSHINEEYYIVKNIILNNLYGVDIMEEAVVIAKMRLFLKLISLVEDSEEIEPLPDIDFNIVSGNSLVGYTSIKKIRNKNLDIRERLEQLEKIKLNDKSMYAEKKRELNGEINRLLWKDYCTEENFETWENNSKPLHWCIEFYEIIEQEGGFDCVIGNPPYVEYYLVRDKYEACNYMTEKCNNLAAFITEKSYEVLSKEGHVGLINPISIISTPRMSDLRKMILSNSSYSFFSNYGDRPGTLFDGVHQKLTILLSKKSKALIFNGGELFTTGYYHWYSGNNKNERMHLFDKIHYTKNKNSKDIDGFILKLGNEMDKAIWQKMQAKSERLYDIIDKEGPGHGISLGMRMTFWPKCFLAKKESNEFNRYYLSSDIDAKTIMALLNSSLFYHYWEIVSDCWHVTNKELKWFKVDLRNMKNSIKNRLAYLAEKLEKDLENKKREVNTAQTKYEYLHKKSKIIIDCIDEVLAEHYSLTEEELDYLKTYNLKYRMTDELENYSKKIFQESELALGF